MLPIFCIKRPIFASVLSIIIVLVGLLAVRVLPLSEYPNITPPSVLIYTKYEGADAKTLARAVASPIENKLSGVEGLLYYTTSIRSNGDVRIQCVFDVGVDANDAMLEINNRVRTVEKSLPDEVRENGVSVRKRSEESLLYIALFSPDQSMSPTQMGDYAHMSLVDDLKQVPGVADVSVFGNTLSAMRIWLDPEKMGALGVTTKDIELAVKAQNAQRTAGRIGTAPTEAEQQLFYSITTPGQLLRPEEFANITIRAEGEKGLVKLRDVATTELGKRSYEFRVDFNREPAINIGVYLQTGANAMAVSKEVKAKIKSLATHFLKGQLAYAITDDITIYVGAALNEVYKTLLEAGLLVLLVVYIFLQNWRATLIPMLAVPVSLIGTLAGLWLLGFSLNTLTLFAMTLAVGIVVDDAIVVLENVDRIMKREKLSAFEASKKAMREVSGALIAIVLVLSSVFIPVAFLGGMAGELYRQFAVTISLSVILSGFVALTLTPALCAVILKNKEEQKGAFFSRFNRALSRFTFVFIQWVKYALHHRLMSALLLLLVMLSGYALLNQIPTSFVPKEDQGIVRMGVQLPDGAAFPRTEEAVAQLTTILEKDPAIDSITAMMGYDSLSGDVRANAASFYLELKPWAQRNVTAIELQEKYQKILKANPDLRGNAMTPAAIPGLGSTNGFAGYIVAKTNDDPMALEMASDVLREALENRAELTGLRFFSSARAPQLALSVDIEKALALGVSPSDVYNTLSNLMGGKYINDFTRNGRTFRVIMQADAQFRNTPEDLGKAYVRSSSGKMIPTSALIETKRVSGAETLTRFNGYLGGQFFGAATGKVSSGEALALVEKIALEVLPEGYEVQWTGQAFHEKRISSSSIAAIGFGALIMFLILAALYERWSLPIAVVLAIPYSFLGAMVAVWIRGTPNDIYFQIGLLVLTGLTAKNAILIVEFAAQKLHEGLGPFDAAIEAVAMRLRPILMTSFAFILGVLPLLLASGAGAAARHSMGTGVFGGMLASTFISTIFVPIFFTWFAKKRKARE